MAKGCVDVDSTYCLYTIGLGAKDIPNLALDRADLVIALGFDMVEYQPRIGIQIVTNASFTPILRLGKLINIFTQKSSWSVISV